jgi:3-deoxy-alpha-D-manno-octulosonate 8-oxidase
MNVMDEFYPRQVDEFRQMALRQGVQIPTGIARDLSAEKYRALYDATLVHVKPLANALGDEFRDVLTFEKVSELFRRM